MCVQSGLLLGIPVVFDTDREDVVVGDKILITYQGQNIGVLTVESKWCPDKLGVCVLGVCTMRLRAACTCGVGWVA
eukprot:543413-Pelagomonas_calceolata.AAC.7